MCLKPEEQEEFLSLKHDPNYQKNLLKVNQNQYAVAAKKGYGRNVTTNMLSNRTSLNMNRNTEDHQSRIVSTKSNTMRKKSKISGMQ
jgi:hypothetical protein